MKKAGLFIASLLILSFLSPLILAQETLPGLEQAPLGEEIQVGQQQYENYTAAQNKSDYLKQEWVKILEKNAILGPIFKAINYLFTALSPFFDRVLGYSSLSWAFIFTLIIWLILFFLINPVTSELFRSGWSGGIGAFIIVSLIGTTGVIKRAVDLLNTLITNTWMFWVSLGAAILFVFIANILGKNVKGKLKKMKKESEEVKTAEAQKTIQTVAETAAKELEDYEGRPGGY